VSDILDRPGYRTAAERVLVAGTSGSGKSTLAGRLAERTGMVHTETDALFHGSGWTPYPEFLTELTELVAGPSWVAEWQYEAALWRILTDREHIIRWAWRTHGWQGTRMRLAAVERPDLDIIRLRTTAEIQRWLDGSLDRAWHLPAD
jgi:energy-coupling factor transporter ATP-binding protein EcfA2